jgi:hypothetical protein
MIPNPVDEACHPLCVVSDVFQAAKCSQHNAGMMNQPLAQTFTE